MTESLEENMACKTNKNLIIVGVNREHEIEQAHDCNLQARLIYLSSAR